MCRHLPPHNQRVGSQLVSYITLTCRLRRRSALARAAMCCMVVLHVGADRRTVCQTQL